MNTFAPYSTWMTPDDQKVLYAAIGDKIAEARKRAKLKQDAFAVMLGLSRSSIVNIEKGRQHVSIHLLLDISDNLKVKFLDLLPAKMIAQKQDTDLMREIEKLPKSESQTKQALRGFVKSLQPNKK